MELAVTLYFLFGKDMSIVDDFFDASGSFHADEDFHSISIENTHNDFDSVVIEEISQDHRYR